MPAVYSSGLHRAIRVRVRFAGIRLITAFREAGAGVDGMVGRIAMWKIKGGESGG